MKTMIQLTRINQASLVLNSELIEHIETTPDTVISLTNGQKIVVRESAGEVMDKVIAYQRRIRQPADLNKPGDVTSASSVKAGSGHDQDEHPPVGQTGR